MLECEENVSIRFSIESKIFSEIKKRNERKVNKFLSLNIILKDLLAFLFTMIAREEKENLKSHRRAFREDLIAYHFHDYSISSVHTKISDNSTTSLMSHNLLHVLIITSMYDNNNNLLFLHFSTHFFFFVNENSR